MKTLRFLLDENFGFDHAACAWVLVEGSSMLSRGQGAPATWPHADTRIAIISAARARVLRLTLPDLPTPQFQAALAYAVETRVAGDPAAQYLAAGLREADGKRRVVVVERDWLRHALAALAGLGVRPQRLVAEAELPEVPPGAWWWQRAAVGGYVLVGDDVLPIDEAGPDLAPPAALLLTLERGSAERPRLLVVTGAEPSPEQQVSWARSLGVVIEWRGQATWQSLPEERLLAAQSLLPDTKLGSATTPPLPPTHSLRWMAAALIVAAALHTAAGIADYLWLRWRAHGIEKAALALLVEQFPEAQATNSAFAAFGEHYARARHAAGLPAPQDALPLLARTVPALAQLGDDKLRQAHFAGGRWTLDVPALEPAQRGQLTAALAQAGFSVIQAEQAGGLRLMLQETQP